MRNRATVLALATASVCATLMGVARWQIATTGTPDRVSVAPLRERPAAMAPDSLADAEDAIVTNDPFRLSNSPSAIRYEPGTDGSGLLAPPPQPRPMLVLKAIVGGPPWQAVIDGIPGQPAGTVAQAGARFDRLTIRAVTRDSVIVLGMDTSWVLSFRAR